MSTEANSAGASPALERRLATILSADVAGYSRMMGVNEEATVQTLRGHRAAFESLLKQYRGRIFSTAGDAILAEFPSAVDAVRCATEIQTALQTRNEHLPAEQKLQFRMGINLGDVVVQDDGDLLGDGVNVASRIQTVAEPGGYAVYRSAESSRAEQQALSTKIAAEREAIEQARRAAEEQSRRAAEAEMRAERDRAAEAARAEAERKLAMTKTTGSAPESAPAAPTATAARAGGTNKFDGAYGGTMCNFPNNAETQLCFSSRFRLENGAADWTWLSRATGKLASARLTIGPDTKVAVAVSGWNRNDGSPLAGTLSGRATDNGIDAQGRWANGATIEAHWTRAP